MSRGKSVPKGPFPDGIDVYHDPLHKIFQGSRDKLPRLVEATDVDLDGEGWIASRPAPEQVEAFSGAQGAWVVDGRLFKQYGGTLYEDSVAIVRGLRRRISIAEHWGRIYLTDGELHRVLDDSTVHVWGLEIPELTLAETSGELPAGTYLVQANFVDAEGNSGGTSDVYAITLSANRGVRVNVSNRPQNAAYINIFLSGTNQKATSFADTVAIQSLPFVLTDEASTEADPPVTELMQGPISDADGIFSFRGFLMMFRDNVVFRSEAQEPHLFHPDNIMQFSGDVTTAAGMHEGMWIGTSRGLYWVAGEDPTEWKPDRITKTAVKKGVGILDGQEFPEAKTEDRVALFLADDGVLLGTTDGRLLHLTERRYFAPSGDRISVAFNERDKSGHSLQQVLIGVV